MANFTNELLFPFIIQRLNLTPNVASMLITHSGCTVTYKLHSNTLHHRMLSALQGL